MSAETAAQPVARPLREGTRWVAGSTRLVALRCLLLVLCSLPMLLGALGAVGAAAQRPYYTDVTGRLPVAHLLRLSDELSSVMAVGLLAGLALFLLLRQLLDAGALAWLDPAGKARSGGVMATVGRAGLAQLWPFCRILLLVALLLLLTGLGVGRLFGWLEIAGERAGYNGWTLILLLPMLKLVLLALLATLIGALAFWCRLITVADGRRRVRRTVLVVFALWRRHPLRAPLVFVGAQLLVGVGTASPLWIWRQHPPATAPGVVVWFGIWLIGLVLAAAVWHWLLRAGLLLYADCSALRETPDHPLGVRQGLQRLYALIRRTVSERRATP